MTEREALIDLLEAIDLAIYSGDWRVDGACDPDAAIQRARDVLAQRSFDYKEHAEGLQRDYDLLLAEYNLLKQDLITIDDIEKIIKFKERNP